MFGLTLEKLLLVGLIAAVVIGPQRLPGAVARLASALRGLRRTVDSARLRAATELGVPADADEWRALDPRQYDPRRIIAEALAARPVAMAADTASVPVPTAPPNTPDTAPPVAPQPPLTPMRRVRVGSSAHPRWIEVPDESGATAPEPDAPAAPADEATVRDAVTA